MMIDFYIKMMRTHPKLPKRDHERMLPMSKHLRGPKNNSIPKFHKFLYVEGHLRV
jgi:hypothetical protein